MERVVGIEPTFPAWKAGVLADIRYPHIFKSLLTSYYCVNFVTMLLTYANKLWCSFLISLYYSFLML